MNLQGSTTTALAIEDESQVGHARRVSQAMATQLGFSEVDAGRVAIVATELATNLLKHAQHGALHLRAIPAQTGSGIELIAVDRGPGFDAARCIADGFSTGGTPGTGLGALTRQSQVLDIYSDSRGSVVLAQLFPRNVSACPLRFGVSQHSLKDDPACGDVWHLAVNGSQICALVIDGIGHGEDAERAGLAGAAAFAVAPFSDPTSSMQDMHQAMNGTRGGAVAIALYDAASSNLRFSGIGNIGACLITAEKSRGLASHPGIVGSQFRKAQVFDYPVEESQLLIMYSDGLQSRWNLRDYPGLVHRHPSIISTLLHRDFCRGRDDVTVMVIALETVRD
ncbi:ATP-binding protein [Stutzerimonas zhaodongensis]|uniref:ATP-binding protein n=1 Tax=Stutzerimonas zhaodongensis TaxID=1176257 RepID=A0A3M2I3F2_9GAMM|nr:ATP-binding protein [Stutzerimonas zhaodongensis]MCQ2031905.1 ATP-binding protein [Stutzerimonas zhaodongensis]MCQ4318529.1 ATP-binding protein [Stutzerimonas zhaodongensis]RMH92744.1 ATP-binding protein [Stutzerimonas zhaodongensis]